jgi:hypothetical protein
MESDTKFVFNKHEAFKRHKNIINMCYCLTGILVGGWICNILAITLAGMSNQYVGDECTCAKINYTVQNVSDTSPDYIVEYRLFCPRTLDYLDFQYGEYSSYEDAYNTVNYLSAYQEHTLCCIVDGQLIPNCTQTYLRANSITIMFVSLLVVLLMLIGMYLILVWYIEVLEKREFYKNSIKVCNETDIEMTTQNSPLISNSE